MTNERLEYLLVQALKYINPSLLGLTKEEACYLGVPGTYVVPVTTAHWVDRGDEWCCSCCGFGKHTEGYWEKPTAKYCEKCGAEINGVEQ